MKTLFAGLAALALLLPCSLSLGDSVLSGTVTASRTEAVSAPYGGLADEIQVHEGDMIAVGDPIVTILPTSVYAPVAGTVSAIFAQPGDSTESIEEKYSAVLYLEPTSRYTVSANTSKAYSSSSTRMIHIGETVYLTCTADGSHMGSGVISAIGDSDEEGNTSYTIEVRSGTLFVGETVKVCRSEDYAAESCIGRGTVAQSKPVAVKGSGSILRLSVQVGDVVERGELLFETVDGSLSGLYAVDNTILSPVAGIIAKAELEEGGSISQDAVLITVYPTEALQAEVEIPVLELSSYQVGQSVTVEVDTGAYDPLQYPGTIARISHMVTSDDSRTKTVKAWIDFEADDSILYGMPVTVVAGN